MCLAVPGQIVQIQDEDGVPTAEVNFGGVKKSVCLQYLPDAKVGEYVVVHVGFAIQRLDEASALETLANFKALGVLDEELGTNLTSSDRRVERSVDIAQEAMQL